MHENNPATEEFINSLKNELQESGVGDNLGDYEASLAEAAQECDADWHALRRQYLEE